MRRPNRSWRVDETYIRWQDNGLIYIGQWIRPATRSALCCRQKGDRVAAKGFLQLALSAHSRPRVINVHGHPAYPGVIDELKQSGELRRKCQCPLSLYMNNNIEQDHRFVKKRVVHSQWFRSVNGALSTIAGYEAMNIVRKGQIRGLAKATSQGRRASLSAHSASLPDIQTRHSIYSRPRRHVCDTARKQVCPSAAVVSGGGFRSTGPNWTSAVGDIRSRRTGVGGWMKLTSN